MNAITVMRALQMGMEIQMEGRTYVWLEEPLPTEWGGQLQGLAIKGKQFEAGQDIDDWDSGTDIYMGTNHMTMNGFIYMCDNLSDEEMFRIRADLGLNSYRKSITKERK